MTAASALGGTIRVVLAVAPRLVRGVLAYALGASGDVAVVAEVSTWEDLPRRVQESGCDVLVSDLNVTTFDRLGDAATGACPVLVLAEPKPHPRLAEMLASRPATLSLLSTNSHPTRVVDALHRICAGESVLDTELVGVAQAMHNPLTSRELDVLQVAAAGWPVRQIARQLELSPGTVRNHLSKVFAKTGARTRMDAVRRARAAGWM